MTSKVKDIEATSREISNFSISYIPGARVVSGLEHEARGRLVPEAECLNRIQPEHPVYKYFVSYHKP